MTTTACAAALGITQPAWNQWELGVREPKLEMLTKIAKLLDVPSDWLLGLRDSAPLRETNIRTGAGAAVAIGANARATVRGTSAPLPGHPLRGLAPLGGYARGESAAPGDAPMCAKCPFKKAAKNFQKIFAK